MNTYIYFLNSGKIIFRVTIFCANLLGILYAKTNKYFPDSSLAGNLWNFSPVSRH